MFRNQKQGDISKNMGSCHSLEIYVTNTGKFLFFEWVTKTGLIAQKTASKKVVHPTAEATE